MTETQYEIAIIGIAWLCWHYGYLAGKKAGRWEKRK